MKHLVAWGVMLLVPMATPTGGIEAEPAGTLPDPLPQNFGYAYTRTGIAAGVFKLEDQVAVFPGSRYGFVKGYRVRLDDDDVLRGEAVLRDGQVYVPSSFAGYLALKDVQPAAPAPEGLKDRWIYTIRHPMFKLPGTVRTLTVDGKPYINFADVGRVMGLHVYEDPTGLVSIGPRASFDFTTHEYSVRDSVVSAFDTPEKFVEPKMAVRYLPRLQSQPTSVPIGPPPGLIAGNDLSGFNAKLLGSPVPAPGVYPRLFFSPEDIAAFRERLKTDPAAQASLAKIAAEFQKTWWNPLTAEGKILDRLSKGSTTPLDADQGHKLAEAATQIALYSLLAGDDAHGAQAAAALANYYKSREPEVDNLLAKPESEFTEADVQLGRSPVNWQGIDDLVNGATLALAYDFAGKWMTPEQKDVMSRVIAKATYGRRQVSRDNAADVAGTTTEGLSQLLAATTLEGQEGYDPEVFAVEAGYARRFLDDAIRNDGNFVPSNLQADGVQMQLLAMLALARRGDNLFGHPHWRSFAALPAQGGTTYRQIAQILHALYPATSPAPTATTETQATPSLPTLLPLVYEMNQAN